MSSGLRVIVYPPDDQGGRRVRVDGEILGRALGPGDLFEFPRRSGLDPDDVDLADALLIEWRGGGPAVWTPDPGPRTGVTSAAAAPRWTPSGGGREWGRLHRHGGALTVQRLKTVWAPRSRGLFVRGQSAFVRPPSTR